MSTDSRGEFERRLLALARDQLDILDRDFSDGWEIADFVLTARFYGAPEPGEPLDAWEGGPYPGWFVSQWTRGSAPAYFLDAELLREALDFTNRRLAASISGDQHEPEGDEAEGDESTGAGRD
jgi:hypothetical protein